MTRKRASGDSEKERGSSLLRTPPLASPVKKLAAKSLHCLFCYKPVSPKLIEANGKNEETLEVKKRRMEVCSRFYSQVTSGSCRKREENKWEKVGDYCKTCDDCFGVIEENCHLLEEIEGLKLRLQWRLDKIYKVMKYAGRVGSRVKEFKGSFQRDEEDGGEGKEDYEEVVGLRQKILNACTKKLKVKDPCVMLKLLETPRNPVEGSEVDANCNIPSGLSAEPEEPEGATDNEDSSSAVMYIIKTEGKDGSRRLVTPPESVIETLRTGTAPMEGSTANHYFFCTPVAADDLPPVPPEEDDEEGSAISGPSADLSVIPGTPVTPAAVKCIKCDLLFLSEQALISHARKSSCFVADNIDLTHSPPKKDNPRLSSKRKRESERKELFPNFKKQKVSSAPKAGSSSEMDVMQVISAADNDNDAIPGTGNVVTHAIDKILSGLRSMFKCSNCSVSFPGEAQYKRHVVSRECFREIKKRSKSATSKNLKDISFSSDDNLENQNSDSEEESLSASSQEDYAPTKRSGSEKKTSSSKNKVPQKRGRPPSKKLQCSEKNCGKGFSNKSELRLHMKKVHLHFGCERCPFTSKLVNEIVGHEVKHHSRKNADGNSLCVRCPGNSKILSTDRYRQIEHYMRRHLSSPTKTK